MIRYIAEFGIAIVVTVLLCQPSLAQRGELVQLEEKLLSPADLITCDFDANVTDVKQAIRRAFEKCRESQKQKYHGRAWAGNGDGKTKQAMSQALQSSGSLYLLLWKGDGDTLARGLLNKQGNEDDAYVYGDISAFGESPVYFKNGQPLIYYADFHIHLSMIEAGKIRVEITVYRSRVVTGLDTSWSPHGPSLSFVQVPPTTIEQYQLLLAIGTELGAKNMPKLQVPTVDGPSKPVKLPRKR